MSEDDASGLVPSPEEMRRLGYRGIDALVRHFEDLPQKPVTPPSVPASWGDII